MGKAGKGGVLNKNFFIGPVFPVGVGDFNATDNNVVQYFKARKPMRGWCFLYE